MTIHVGKAELDDGEQVALHKASKTLKIAGFRKGRAPLAVVAKHVDQQQLALETADNAISVAVVKAFEGEDLRAIMRPEVNVTKFIPGQELEFTATADVLPEVKLGNYKKITGATRAKVSVSKADVEEVLERIRSQMSAKSVVKRAAVVNDEVSIDFVGKKDGEAFEGGTANDYALTLGSKAFIPGFEEAIVGHKSGDEFAIDATFPKDYQAPNLAGQKVVFDITLKEVRENKLPDLTDELAAKVGPYSSVKDLQADIKKELTAQKTRESDEAYKNMLVEKLVEKSTVDVPQVLIDDQLQSIEQDLGQNLARQGMNLDQYYQQRNFKDRDDWVKKEGNDLAVERVKTSLVVAALSKKEKVTASSQDLAARIAEFKDQYKNDPETVKRFDEPEVQRDVANRLITERTIDRLVELNA